MPDSLDRLVRDAQDGRVPSVVAVAVTDLADLVVSLGEFVGQLIEKSAAVDEQLTQLSNDVASATRKTTTARTTSKEN